MGESVQTNKIIQAIDHDDHQPFEIQVRLDIPNSQVVPKSDIEALVNAFADKCTERGLPVTIIATKGTIVDQPQPRPFRFPIK